MQSLIKCVKIPNKDLFKCSYETVVCNFRKKKTSKALIAPLEFNRSISVPVEKGIKGNQVSIDQDNSSKKRVSKEDR